jgi:hypothetical protein
MSIFERIQMSPSPEAEILRQIEDLIRKVATGSASQSDVQLLQDLQRRRVELMRPNVFSQETPYREAV